MKIKCNREEIQALFNLFTKIVSEPVNNIPDSLVIDLLKPIHLKLKTKMKFNLSNNGWNLSLTELQAKSYYTFFKGRYLGEKFVYEQIVIDKHLKAIDKQIVLYPPF